MTAASTGRARSEGLRKVIHVGCGFFALTLRWLSWPAALGMALAAIVFGGFIAPRTLGRFLHREDERRRGWSPAIVFYAVSVAVLIVIFRNHLEFAAAGWALMAFGDGMATVVGLRWGTHALPWNATKSWEGLVAHVALGGLAALAALTLVSPYASESLHDPSLPQADWILPLACLTAALATGFIETVDSGIDDNLTVPLLGGGVAWLATMVLTDLDAAECEEAMLRGGMALAVCALPAALAVSMRALTGRGAIAAATLGAIVAGGAGWGGLAVLFAFFILGTGATKVGRRVKAARGIEEPRGGRRSVGNVLANGGMAAACGLLMIPLAMDFSLLAGSALDLRAGAAVAFTAALATAAFDTVSSEVGKAFGRRTFLVTTFRAVPPGTEGAVSLEGTLAGMLASVLIAAAALALGVLPQRVGWISAHAVVAGAFIGTTFESIVGALVESKGHRIDNNFLNFANTVVGGLSAVWIYQVWRVIP